MLRALAGLAAANWHLTIIGNGDRRAAYEKQAADLGLATKVEFAGYVSEADKIRAYQNADLLLLPSVNNNEAFGLVLIEALACGAPVIASDLPGVRRVFANYQEGLLAEPGSASDLKSKLEFIMNNEDRRREMATAARRLAEAKYDERLMARGLAELFNL
jgi:glycosyltransferase involved in cell wall biosynthesis